MTGEDVIFQRYKHRPVDAALPSNLKILYDANTVQDMLMWRRFCWRVARSATSLLSMATAATTPRESYDS